MQAYVQFNSTAPTPLPGAEVMAPMNEASVREQLSQALAEVTALRTMMACLPTQVAQAVAAATLKPTVEPYGKVGIAHVVPIMPVGKKSYQTIRKMVRAQLLPAEREGHIYVFDLAAVKEALDTSRQKQSDAEWVANNCNRAIRRRDREERARLKAMAKSRAA